MSTTQQIAELRDKSAELDALTAELAVVEADLQALKDEHFDLETKIDDSLRDPDVKVGDVASMLSDWKEQTRRLGELQRKLEGISPVTDNLRTTIGSLSKQIKRDA